MLETNISLSLEPPLPRNSARPTKTPATAKIPSVTNASTVTYRRCIVPLLLGLLRQHRRTQQRTRFGMVGLDVGLSAGFVISSPRERRGREKCLCLGLHFCKRRVGHGALAAEMWTSESGSDGQHAEICCSLRRGGAGKDVRRR